MVGWRGVDGRTYGPENAAGASSSFFGVWVLLLGCGVWGAPYQPVPGFGVYPKPSTLNPRVWSFRVETGLVLGLVPQVGIRVWAVGRIIDLHRHRKGCRRKHIALNPKP